MLSLLPHAARQRMAGLGWRLANSPIALPGLLAIVVALSALTVLMETPRQDSAFYADSSKARAPAPPSARFQVAESLVGKPAIRGGRMIIDQEIFAADGTLFLGSSNTTWKEAQSYCRSSAQGRLCLETELCPWIRQEVALSPHADRWIPLHRDLGWRETAIQQHQDHLASLKQRARKARHTTGANWEELERYIREKEDAIEKLLDEALGQGGSRKGEIWLEVGNCGLSKYPTGHSHRGMVVCCSGRQENTNFAHPRSEIKVTVPQPPLPQSPQLPFTPPPSNGSAAFKRVFPKRKRKIRHW